MWPNSQHLIEMPRVPSQIKIKGDRVTLTPVFYSYWKFAAERQNIFFRRLGGANAFPVTKDEILQSFKFTNSYRASDRVSQFLIRQVIYGEGYSDQPDDIFFRILLFKLFNKIETWRLLESKLGRISLSMYDYDALDAVLSMAMKSGIRIYSAAYIMPSAGGAFGKSYKHQNHLKLVEMMLNEGFPERIGQARSMAEVYELMASAPSIGPFLAYQFSTDLNYSPLTTFSEMDFVVAGPGALDGISKCFVDGHKLDPRAVITYMADHQAEWFERLGIPFADLWGRPLQLIDCQNLFCEISKYSRAAFPAVQGISGRTRIKQKFSPQGRPPAPWYPPKWGINDRIGVTLHQSLGGCETASTVQYTLF
jgi:hypothetical protein